MWFGSWSNALSGEPYSSALYANARHFAAILWIIWVRVRDTHPAVFVTLLYFLQYAKNRVDTGDFFILYYFN